MIKNYTGGSLWIKLRGQCIYFWQFYVFRKYSTVFTFRHYLNIHLNTYTLQTCISDFISHLSYHDECTQNWHYALQITFKVTFFFSRTIFVLQFHFLVLSFSTKWLPKCFSFTRIQFLVDRVINCFTQKISYSTLTSLIIKGFLNVFVLI